MDIIKIFVILIFGFLNGLSQGQKCSSPDITDREFEIGYNNKEKLKLTYPADLEIKKFYMENTVRIGSTRNNEWEQLYIDARLDDKYLIIFTTEKLKNYTYDQSDTKINLIIELECAGQSRNLIFRQEIEKTNDYDPEFSQSVYDFEVSLPLFKGYDLTNFQNISARDIDLFDNEITFSSDDSGVIQVGNANIVSDDKKTFFASLVLQRPLMSITDAIEFTIKAQDSGSPPRSSTAKVIIRADHTNTVPPQPKFQKILYQGTLDERRSLQLENVELIRSTWSKEVTFTTFGTDSSLFKIVGVDSFVMIHLARPLTDDDLENKTLLSFGISAAVPDISEGRTGIVISIPVDKTVFQFTKRVYKGTIDESTQFALKEEIGFVENAIPNDLKLDGQDAEFFEVDLVENKVKLKLKNGLNEDLLKDRNYLQFSIIAKLKEDFQATASVVVDIEFLKSPQFTKPLYKGKLTEANQVATEKISFVENSIFDGVALSLTGTDSALFTIERNGYNLLLKANGRIDDELIKGKNYLECTIVASTKRFKSTATVVIDPGPMVVFQFTKNVYEGSIDESIQFSLKEEIGFVENAIPKEMKLDGKDAEFFEVDLMENKVKLKLKNGLNEDLLKDRNYLQFSIIAKLKEDSQATASVVVDINFLKAPQFTKPFYKGKLTESNQVATEKISFVENSIFDGVELALTGTDSDLFTVERNGYNVLLKTNGRIDDELIKGKSFLECTIVASTKRFKSTTTVVIDIGAQTECEDCTTQEPCIPCPSTEPTNIPPNEVPEFEKEVYTFLLAPSFIGKFGVVRASVNNPSTQLEYSLSTASDHLNSRLQIDRITGDLTITNVVSPGQYVSSVMAKYPASDEIGTARLVIFVRAVNNCPNGTTVSKSLLIKHLDEGVEHRDILDVNEGDCTFSIYHLDPNDKEYLKIDPESGKIISIALDREDEVFSQMLVPQIRAELELNCGQQDEDDDLHKYIDRKRRKRSVYIDENGNETRDTPRYKSLVLTSDIAFSAKVMVLSVIIEDINDNSPEFIYPPKSNFLIGYPTADVSADLLPDFLMKIEATDKDAGLNAVVRYKVDRNDHFGIEPTTGIVYPFKNAMNGVDKITLRLYATDRDGAADGNSVYVDVIVRKLSSEHLTLLTFDGRKLEDIDKLIGDIKDKTGVGFVVLKKAVIPSPNSGKAGDYSRMLNVNVRQEDQVTTLKVWVYAFNQQDDPIGSIEIENKLSTVAEEFGVSATSYEKAKNSFVGSSEASTKTSVTGYIVSVCLLSVILLGLGGFVVFWYYKHHIKYRRMGHANTPETSSYNDGTERDIGYKIPAQDFFQPGGNYNRSSIRLNGTTTQETSDEHGEYAISEGNRRKSIVAIVDNSEDCGDEADTEATSNEKLRTTVTFNELVERIDIESDDGSEQTSVSSEARL